jgi:hypothetical protein
VIALGATRFVSFSAAIAPLRFLYAHPA